MQNLKAMIVGVSGLSLTAAEKDFIAENQPWAFSVGEKA